MKTSSGFLISSRVADILRAKIRPQLLFPILHTVLCIDGMELVRALEKAKTYKEIAEILKAHLMNFADFNAVQHPNVKTDYFSEAGVTFHCSVLSNDVSTPIKIKEAFSILNQKLDINKGIFKQEGYEAYYIRLQLNASFVPLVTPLIQNAKKVRQKQFSNLYMRYEAHEKGHEFIQSDEELKVLKKQVADRKKFLKTQAKKIEENYIKDNSVEITKEEEELYILAGESLQYIPL